MSKIGRGGYEMSGLSYKTRAGSTPNGKPKIYFCCHPQGFLRYFEKISGEILELWDCSIWYDSLHGTPEYDRSRDELFRDDLMQMQMFVVLITEEFLYCENRARCEEFVLAKEHHIPILPILVNQGLAAEFNRICGNIQFLDRTSTDITEIPYKEKLKKFMESVLITEDFKNKIREAFDAYVFLSYRKKDRKYAQELMRLIHAHEFCRDIAIWYDEFLVPGENFNDSIQKALKSSKIFAMAVTPNLVNEKNYVMETEYPMAKNSDIRILPVEMQPTDRSRLNECYEALPECISARNDVSLANTLRNALNDIAVCEKNSSPEHLFFIGLAYLGGVDVEVDPPKGVGLIREAAEAGVSEAIDKLVALYQTGYGIAMDYEQAIIWQEKLVMNREQEFEKCPCEEKAIVLLDSKMKLGNMYIEVYNDLRADCVCEQFFQLLNDRKPYIQHSQEQNYCLWYYETKANIYGAHGNVKEQRKVIQKYQQLAYEYWEESGTEHAFHMNIAGYANIAAVEMNAGNLEDARIGYEKAKQLSEVLDEKVQSEETKQLRLKLYLKCGDILYRQQKIAGAMQEYQRALRLAEQLEKDHPSSFHKKQIFACYKALGDGCSYRDNFACIGGKKDAQEFYKKGLAIIEKLAEQESTINHKRMLATAYENLADELLRAKDLMEEPPKEALEYYRKALELAKQFVECSHSSQSWMDLAGSYEKIGSFYGVSDAAKSLKNETTDSGLELEYLVMAARASEKAVDRSGGIVAKRNLWVAYFRLKTFYMTKEDIQNRKLYHQKMLLLSKEICEETHSLEDEMMLVSDYREMSNIADLEEDYESEEKYKQKSLAICKTIVAKEPSVAKYQKNLAMEYYNHANFYERMGRKEEEFDCHKKRLAILEEVGLEDFSTANQWQIAGAYREIAKYYCANKDWETAKLYLQKNVDIYEKLAKEECDINSLDRMMDAWSYFAVNAERCERYEEANQYVMRELEVAKQLYEKENYDTSRYHKLVYGYKCLVRNCLCSKNYEEAKKYEKEYYELAKGAQQKFGPDIRMISGNSPIEYFGYCLRLMHQLYEEQAELWKENKEYEDAKKAYEEAIHYCEEFTKAFPEDCSGRFRLAAMNFKRGLAEPGYCYCYYMRQAAEIWEKLAEEYPDNVSYSHNAKVARSNLEEDS